VRNYGREGSNTRVERKDDSVLDSGGTPLGVLRYFKWGCDSFSPEGLRKLAGGWHPERSTDQPLSCIYNDSTASHLRRNRRRFALVENMPRHEFRYLPEVPWDWWTEDSVNFGIVVVGFG
jgi:hypothetical protein